MPFVSKAQVRALYAKDPAVAREFAAATPSIKALPERKGSALFIVTVPLTSGSMV